MQKNRQLKNPGVSVVVEDGEYVFRLDGENLHKNTMDIGQMAKFLDALYGMAWTSSRDLPETREGAIVIGDIEDNCVTFRMTAKGMAAAAMLALVGFLDGNNSDPAPDFGTKVGEMNSFLKKNRYSLTVNNTREFNKSYGGKSGEIPKPKETRPMKYQTTVYGKLESIGGAKINIHIRMSNPDQVVILEASEEMAKKLAGRIFDVVGVKAMVESINGDICGGRVLEMLPYNHKKGVNPFDRLRKAVNGAFDGVNAEEYIRQVRG